MGACVGCTNVYNTIKQNKNRNQKLYITANRVFKKISKGQNYIDEASITNYFEDYQASYCKIIFRQMDFDNDKKITHEKWIGYWEYIRRSGHKTTQIMEQLKSIQNGSIKLNFPKALQYDRISPRTTIISDVIRDLTTESVLPFPLQK